MEAVGEKRRAAFGVVRVVTAVHKATRNTRNDITKVVLPGCTNELLASVVEIVMRLRNCAVVDLSRSLLGADKLRSRHRGKLAELLELKHVVFVDVHDTPLAEDAEVWRRLVKDERVSKHAAKLIEAWPSQTPKVDDEQVRVSHVAYWQRRGNEAGLRAGRVRAAAAVGRQERFVGLDLGRHLRLPGDGDRRFGWSGVVVVASCGSAGVAGALDGSRLGLVHRELRRLKVPAGLECCVVLNCMPLDGSEDEQVDLEEVRAWQREVLLRLQPWRVAALGTAASVVTLSALACPLFSTWKVLDRLYALLEKQVVPWHAERCLSVVSRSHPQCLVQLCPDLVALGESDGGNAKWDGLWFIGGSDPSERVAELFPVLKAHACEPSIGDVADAVWWCSAMRFDDEATSPSLQQPVAPPVCDSPVVEPKDKYAGPGYEMFASGDGGDRYGVYDSGESVTGSYGPAAGASIVGHGYYDGYADMDAEVPGDGTDETRGELFEERLVLKPLPSAQELRRQGSGGDSNGGGVVKGRMPDAASEESSSMHGT